MNIWLPIITNLIMLGILVAGIFVGKKNGWKIELSKLVIMLGVAVGIYFLAPIITTPIVTTLANGQSIAEIMIHIPYMIQGINSLIMFLLFIIIYGILSLICSAIANKVAKKQNSITYIKLKGKGNGKLNRQNKKLYRKQIREARKQKKTSQTIGALFGFILAACITFVLFMPMGYAFKQLEQTAPGITAGFEYTVWGQLDKATEVYDKINQPTIHKLTETDLTIELGE